MITTVVSDFSRVLLFPRDASLNEPLNHLIRRLKLDESYDFNDHFSVNTTLLRFYKSLLPEVETVIFTSGTIQDEPELQSYLAGTIQKIFSAEYHQRPKSLVSSYTWLAEQVHHQPQEMMFIDDSPTNCAAASQAGMQTIQFIDTEQVIAQVTTLIKNTTNPTA